MNQHIATGLVSYQDIYYESNFLDKCYFVIKRPCDCSITELHYFYLLLRKGNKVSPIDLPLKILNSDYLGFCYQNKKLVGISAIKSPTRSYLEDVHLKAGIIYTIDRPFLEIGYSFTLACFRRKGISGTLKRMLLGKVRHHQGILFSTTAIPSSQRFLMANGFHPQGNPYRGNYDNNIIYFEKEMQPGFT
ncbi:hypothetical protein DU508_16490 [Pedobacter chinensis]|uniref:N-acetyltransferase domain-containing protein n=1 Tax=Pedobacter chinensis TaxID=2282421 RepID=A0A369PXZ2_9SPHI|nr:hypothetical protein [Pedobacter chinensis]RDC55857.1 hypothetical protein DU508_16490 [Pedobacter chinensis]